jgi:putative hemolysin
MGKQVGTGRWDEPYGENSETVQSVVGSTRGYTCSRMLSEFIKPVKVMCEILEERSVSVYVRVCAMKLMNYREKGNVLVFPDGMAQYGKSDQSRWTRKCSSCNTSPARLYVTVCIVYNHSYNEEPVEY